MQSLKLIMTTGLELDFGKKPSKGLSTVLFRLFMLGDVDIKGNVTGAIFY